MHSCDTCHKLHSVMPSMHWLQAAFVCMSVPVVMAAAEQILTQHARLVVRVLSHCHLMFDCPATSVQRDTMFDEIRSALQDVAGGISMCRVCCASMV
jgi:hypothetical protein